MFDQLMEAIEAQEAERVVGILATGVDIERTQKSTRLTPLALAAKKGNLRIVDMLLAKGADVSNFSDDPDTVPLIVACANGYFQVVEKLLKNGADVNTATWPDYETPLKAASRRGHRQIVKLLLDAGASRDFRSRHDCSGDFFDQETALMAAVCHDQVEAARTLLENGADPNFGNFNDKDYPLMVACRKGNSELAELLIDFGAATWIEDDAKWTPLLWACDNGETDVARLLIDKGADINRLNRPTALIVTCSEGHIETARMLLDLGAEIDLVNRKGTTALLAALKNGHEDLAMMLLERGASFGWHPVLDRRKQIAKRLVALDSTFEEKRALPNQTPLMWASFWGYEKVVSFMLDKGVDVNEWDTSGKTALMVAVCEGKLEVVKLLLGKRPDIDSQDADGLSALMWAAAWGRDEVALTLLDAGANINQTDRLGQTALDYAMKGNHQSALNILHARGSAVQQRTTTYDLDVVIMQSYPYPIAYSYRLVDSFYQPLEIYRALLRVGENIMAFLGSITIAVARNKDEEGLRGNVASNWRGGMSPGDWIQLIRESLNLLENTQDDPLARDLFFLWRQKKKETAFARALRGITQMKNDYKHDRAPTSQSLIMRESANLRLKLREIMEGLHLFLNYPIRSIIDMNVDAKTSEMIFKTVRFSGDHPVLNTEEIRFPKPLPRNLLYIQNNSNRWISLDPFLTFQECPECGHMETYFIDKWPEKNGVAQLKSFERGHTLGSDEIGETLGGLFNSDQ